jgi:hypothetical protein
MYAFYTCVILIHSIHVMFKIVTANEQCVCMPALEKTVLSRSGFVSTTKLVYLLFWVSRTPYFACLLFISVSLSKSHSLQLCELYMYARLSLRNESSISYFEPPIVIICESKANKFIMMESNCLSCVDYSCLK